VPDKPGPLSSRLRRHPLFLDEVAILPAGPMQVKLLRALSRKRKAVRPTCGINTSNRRERMVSELLWADCSKRGLLCTSRDGVPRGGSARNSVSNFIALKSLLQSIVHSRVILIACARRPQLNQTSEDIPACFTRPHPQRASRAQRHAASTVSPEIPGMRLEQLPLSWHVRELRISSERAQPYCDGGQLNQANDIQYRRPAPSSQGFSIPSLNPIDRWRITWTISTRPRFYSGTGRNTLRKTARPRAWA